MKHLQYFSTSKQTLATMVIAIFFNFAFSAAAQTPPPTQTNLGYNDVLAPQLLVWCNGSGLTCNSVGWYFTPSVNFNLTAVQTNFNAVVQPGSQDREVTIEILSDRRFVGGTLLRSATFNSSTARGRLGGASFAPVTLTAGTRYFIGFRNVAGIGINTTNDAGSIDCGACLHLDNDGDTTGQYRLRGGSNVPSAQDKPIVRFVGTPVGNGGGASRNYDFDGDGRADLAVFRPASGTWYLLNSTSGFSGIQFGANGDVPVSGDYDGDGRTDIAVFRPSNGIWYILRSSDGAFQGVQFGSAGDQPTPTDFDGDGKSDVAVFRPSSGFWYYLRSSNGSFGSAQFGTNGDIPVSGIR